MVSRKLFVYCILIFAGCTAGLFASAPRLQFWKQERNQADYQLARMHAAEKQREELIRSQARANSRLGKEAIARGKGWLKPGESPG